ncbi:hypothetical protein AFLA_008312 [Aspergillus flavus NRRL3357]|nr:hypothetical protein AFLA_008312 [Aspergillus flavus NRRL3357]
MIPVGDQEPSLSFGLACLVRRSCWALILRKVRATKRGRKVETDRSSSKRGQRVSGTGTAFGGLDMQMDPRRVSGDSFRDDVWMGDDGSRVNSGGMVTGIGLTGFYNSSQDFFPIIRYYVSSGLFDPSHIQVQESPFGLVETVSGRHEVGVW